MRIRSSGAARPSRRALLLGGFAAGGGALAAGAAFGQRAQAPAGPTSIRVEASPFGRFWPASPDKTRQGALTFRSGLVLRSEFPGFGGFSGLSRNAAGRIVAINDAATWLTADLVIRDDGALAGLENAVVAPIIGASGRPLRRSRSYDTEGLAIAGGSAYVAIERTQEVAVFDFGRQGVSARAKSIPVPREAKSLPSNTGLEAIAVAPPRHPLAGALIVIAEQVDNAAQSPTVGFILTGAKKGRFEVARSQGYDITDLVFHPGGDALLLERRFSLLGGLAIRLRRLPAESIRPGGVVDGPVIFEAGGGAEIDNFEGLALHQEGASTVLTLISDDNFSRLQRTLLVEFLLDG